MAKKSRSDQWLSELKRGDPFEPIIGNIGVRIEVRVVLDRASDWGYVTELLDRAREVGAAEIVGFDKIEE